MCLSIVSNKGKTTVGFNLDILNMQYRVNAGDDRFYVEIYDQTEGWMPLFGANARGEFVAMPTCWPYDSRSDYSEGAINVINLDADLLLCKTTFADAVNTARTKKICSVPGLTFQSQLSDKDGNVLQVVPGQGVEYKTKPELSLMANFSLYKWDSETHPWMGLDRYKAAKKVLDDSKSVDYRECMSALAAAANHDCPTVISIVFVPSEMTVYYCLDMQYDKVYTHKIEVKA